MPVHQVGLPADMDAFLELGERYGVAIVEDAACAIGAQYKGAPIGALGPIACFSLHPRKVITTGEGGMITLHDAGLAERLRHLRHTPWASRTWRVTTPIASSSRVIRSAASITA